MHIIPDSYDNSLPENSQLREFSKCITDVSATVGLDLKVATKFKGLLHDAGFEDVQEVAYDLPMGDWPEDRRMKEVGRYQRFQFMEGLPAIGTALFTRVEGWTKDRFDVFMAGVRREGNSRNVHIFYKM
jgi:hypothetical protein